MYHLEKTDFTSKCIKGQFLFAAILITNLMGSCLDTGANTSKYSIADFYRNPLATNSALCFETEPFDFNFILKTHLILMAFLF